MGDEFIILCLDGCIVDPVFKPNTANAEIKGLQEIVSPFLMPIFSRPHYYSYHKRGQFKVNYFVLAVVFDSTCNLFSVNN